MAKTIVGLFDNFSDAQSAVRDLVNVGFSRDDLSLVANDERGEYSKTLTVEGETSSTAAGAGTGAVLGGLGGLLVGLGALAIPGVGPVIAAGPLVATLLGAGVGAAAGGMIGALIDAGVPETEAGYYAEGVRRGGTLVAVRANDEMMVERAANILERHNAVDVDRRVTDWQQSGWKGYDPKAGPHTTSSTTASSRTAATAVPSAAATSRTATSATAPATARTRDAGQGETAIPVVEEELHVGKRTVERGGVRVYSRVTEKPVEEQVRLRDETVSIERRPVNRPVSDADAAALKDKVIEVRETDEEVVVAKSARVVEEVAVRKGVQERTETVRDTVRRTDVEVEKLGTERGASPSGYDAYADDFRNNFTTTYGKRGLAYDRYEPAYRYGHTLAGDKRYTGKDWSAIEADARRDWERDNKGAWDEFKDSVRYAWDRVRGRSPRRAA